MGLSNLTDKYNRIIDYLRISVTDRCNLRCFYCSDGTEQTIRNTLHNEQFLAIAQAAAELGFNKVRLTGGEPLLYHGIADLAESLRNRLQYPIVAITTNGVLLTKTMCNRLYNAGVTAITISLDSLDKLEYASITGADKLDTVLEHIDYAAQSGFESIKLNMVIFRSTTIDSINRMKDYCTKRKIQLQTIGKFSLTDRYELDTTVIQTDRPLPCSKCNRIRLTCDGYIIPCLFSDIRYPVNFNTIENSICKAIEAKPESGKSCKRSTLQSIGG
jgi:GTP 3',8-cyclase